MKLLPNLYYYLWPGTGNNCNTYLFAGEVLALVDPGHVANELNEPCYEMLAGHLRADGFKPEDIDLIILTHAHPDHSEAASKFKEMGRARIAMHQTEEAYWETLSRLFGLGRRGAGLVADFYLTEGELNLGTREKLTLEIIHTPGHSPGSISIYWPREKVLITGDVVFASSIGRTDLPQGDSRKLKESIERLSKLDVEYLLPGHMGIVKSRDQVNRNFQYIKRVFYPYL